MLRLHGPVPRPLAIAMDKLEAPAMGVPHLTFRGVEQLKKPSAARTKRKPYLASTDTPVATVRTALRRTIS